MGFQARMNSHSSNSVSYSEGSVDLLGSYCSRLGLDPRQNRFHAPIVFHEDYSFHGWPESHTFPVSHSIQCEDSNLIFSSVDAQICRPGA